MAFPHVWSATEDNQPTGSTPIGQGDDYIAATRQMVRERIGLEHNFDFTNDAEQGSHREGSARVWVSETEPEDPIPAVTAETVGQLKKGRFWFKPSTGEAFVYDLGRAAWKAINITGAQLIGLVTALSAKSTVAAADKILILDSSAGGAGKLITADKFATAAQGVKADNALPAASYTAADVLAKVKTVDGVGSGLDADTVDSLHANEFATAEQGAKADAALPAASYTAEDILTKIETVDGADSGLDADLLDGQHASEFATATQGATADAASKPVDAGSSRHAGGTIKTKIFQLSFGAGDSQKSVAHGISNALTNHRIIAICGVGNDGFEAVGLSSDFGALISHITYDNTNLTGYRGPSTSARTIYVTVMYV